MLDTFAETADTAQLTQRVFSLFPTAPRLVADSHQFFQAYVQHSQAMRAKGSWDPRKENRKVNMIKKLFISMEPAELNIVGQKLRRDCLEIWYANTFEFLLWLNNGLHEEEINGLAREYLAELRCICWFDVRQDQELQATFSQIWIFIINGDEDEMWSFLESVTDPERRNTARNIFYEYRRNRETVPRVRPLVGFSG